VGEGAHRREVERAHAFVLRQRQDSLRKRRYLLELVARRDGLKRRRTIRQLLNQHRDPARVAFVRAPVKDQL